MSVREIGILKMLNNKPDIDESDLLWGLYPDLISATNEQIDTYKLDILNTIAKYDLNKSIDKFLAYELSDALFSRLFKDLSLIYIMCDEYKVFENLYKNLLNEISNSERYSHIDAIKRSLILNISTALINNPSEFTRFDRYIESSFIEFQLDAKLDLSDMYFPYLQSEGEQLKSISDLYNLIYNKYFLSMDFCTFISYIDKGILKKLELNQLDVPLINSLDFSLGFSVYDLLNIVSVKDIETVLAIKDINPSKTSAIKKIADTFTEKTFDEYLSKLPADYHSHMWNIPSHQIKSEVITRNIVKKYYPLLLQDYTMTDKIARNFSLKEMLNILEEECV